MSKGDGLSTVRRDSLRTSRRFKSLPEQDPAPIYQTDLYGLSRNVVLDDALQGRLIDHYERDMAVWRVLPAQEKKQEGLFELGPDKEDDSLQIFIDLKP